MSAEFEPPIHEQVLAMQESVLKEASVRLVDAEVSRRVGLTRKHELLETRAALLGFSEALEVHVTTRIQALPHGWDSVSGLSSVEEEIEGRARSIYTSVSQLTLEQSFTRRRFDRLRVSRTGKAVGSIASSFAATTALFAGTEAAGQVLDIGIVRSIGAVSLTSLFIKKLAGNQGRNVAQKVFGERYRRYLQPVSPDISEEVKNTHKAMKARGGGLTLGQRSLLTRHLEIDYRIEQLDMRLSSSEAKQLKMAASEHTPEGFARMFAHTTANSFAAVWDLGKIEYGAEPTEPSHNIDKIA